MYFLSERECDVWFSSDDTICCVDGASMYDKEGPRLPKGAIKQLIGEPNYQWVIGELYLESAIISFILRAGGKRTTAHRDSHH